MATVELSHFLPVASTTPDTLSSKQRAGILKQYLESNRKLEEIHSTADHILESIKNAIQEAEQRLINLNNYVYLAIKDQTPE